MAVDKRWWDITLPEFAGDKVTTGINEHARTVKVAGSPQNSGAAAMMYAASQDADKIVMLGYDCKPDKNGKRHWHGAHVDGLGDALSMPKWPSQFRQIVQHLRHIDVVNCTRDTDLKFWPQAELEGEL